MATKFVVRVDTMHAKVLNGSLAFAQQKMASAWPVPSKSKELKSSIKLADPQVIATGRVLWVNHCKSCHGIRGLGDGTQSASLKTFPGDFSRAAFQGSSDGEIFYRLNKGRDEMPSFETKIPVVNDRWGLVAVIRTFKK